jgi:hypothetical protein
MAFQTYNPQKCTFAWNGIIPVQFAEGAFIRVSYNADAYTLSVGSDGQAARTLNADKSATFEITLMASSPTNDLYSAQATADRLAGTGVHKGMVKDASGTARASAENLWIKKAADMERAKELGTATWVFETDNLDLFVGGTTEL